MSALPAGNQRQVTRHIIVWQPNVISVTDGDILMKFAIFRSVEDANALGHVVDNCLVNLLTQPDTQSTYGGTYPDNDDLNTLVDDY